MTRPIKNERQAVADMYSEYNDNSASTEADAEYTVDEFSDHDYTAAANSVETIYATQPFKAAQARHDDKIQDGGRGAGQRIVAVAQAAPLHEVTNRDNVQTTAVKRNPSKAQGTSAAEESAVHPFPRKGLSARQAHVTGTPAQVPSEPKSMKRSLATDMIAAEEVADFGEIGVREESRQAEAEVIAKRPKQETPLGYFTIPRELRSIKVTNSKIDLQALWKERSDAVAHVEHIDWQTVTGEEDETTLTAGVFGAMQDSVNNISHRYRSLADDFARLSNVKNDTLTHKKYTTELYGEAGGRYAKDCAIIQEQTSSLQLPARGRSKSRAPSAARG